MVKFLRNVQGKNYMFSLYNRKQIMLLKNAVILCSVIEINSTILTCKIIEMMYPENFSYF